MNRDRVALALVAVVAVAVVGVAASSLQTAEVESGFGIGPGNTTPVDVNQSNASSPGVSGGGGLFGPGGGIFDGAGGSADGGDAGSGSVTLGVLALALCVAAASVVVVLWATGGDGSPPPPEPDTEEATESTSSGGPRTAVDPANEVYRAWWEMVRRLDVPRAASRSPAEFAAAAVEAGLDPETVSELTDLFRTVRYGDVPATDDAERRAARASDRIRSRRPAGEETES